VYGTVPPQIVKKKIILRYLLQLWHTKQGTVVPYCYTFTKSCFWICSSSSFM